MMQEERRDGGFDVRVSIGCGGVCRNRSAWEILRPTAWSAKHSRASANQAASISVDFGRPSWWDDESRGQHSLHRMALDGRGRRRWTDHQVGQLSSWCALQLHRRSGKRGAAHVLLVPSASHVHASLTKHAGRSTGRLAGVGAVSWGLGTAEPAHWRVEGARPRAKQAPWRRGSTTDQASTELQAVITVVSASCLPISTEASSGPRVHYLFTASTTTGGGDEARDA